ncbi:LD-carboxypeptidase [bacterium]|nr:LD-carboxypeptidase [bacterium]
MKPRRLGRGDLVSLVAPSGSASDAARVEASARALESIGLRVKASSHCADARGYLAGEDAARAGELEAAFADPETAAVICLKGGYGTPRILDRIDYGIVAAHPKVFLGYSDITALHVAFYQRAGLATIHGPMPSSDMVPDFDPDSRAALERVLFGGVAEAGAFAAGGFAPVAVRNPGGRPFSALSDGVAEGPLVGGNLSLLAATMGTPYALQAEGKIVFIEDVDEAPYRIDRMLTQLRLAGVFEACAGVVFGAWTRCEPSAGKRSLSINEVIEDIVVPCGKPILAGVEAGHCAPTLTLPLGVRWRLDADGAALTLLESPFSD